MSFFGVLMMERERDNDGGGNVMVGSWRWLLAKKMKDGMAYLEVLVGWKDEVWGIDGGNS